MIRRQYKLKKIHRQAPGCYHRIITRRSMRIAHHLLQLINWHVTRHSARDVADGEEWAGCEELSMICQFYIEARRWQS